MNRSKQENNYQIKKFNKKLQCSNLFWGKMLHCYCGAHETNGGRKLKLLILVVNKRNYGIGEQKKDLSLRISVSPPPPLG